MAISHVGTATGTSANGVVTVTLPGGVLPGDVVYVAAAGRTDTVVSESTGTWTSLFPRVFKDDSNNINACLFRKRMGSPVDTSVTITCGSGTSLTAAAAKVLRGVDPQFQEDIVTIPVASSVSAATPDPPAATSVTPGAWAIAIGYSSEGDNIVTPPAGYGNLVDIQNGATNVMMSDKVLPSPTTEDPADYADVVGDTGDVWVACTVLVRPARQGLSMMTLLGAGRSVVVGGAVEPPQIFLMFDEARIGDISEFGFLDLLVVYQSSMVAPGEAATDPPNLTFLDGFFADLKTNNPSVEQIVLDHEAWTLITGATATSVNTTTVGWYVDLVSAAQAHFGDVGLYGEVPERYTLYLNFPPGDPTFVTRRANWFSRAAIMQPMWDQVSTLWPSLYYINPVYNNVADRDMWYADNLEMCGQFAPGKHVYAFMWPRIHNSVDPATPYIDGQYWYDSLNQLLSLEYSGFALWLFSADVDPRTLTPVPDWWTKMVEFSQIV